MNIKDNLLKLKSEIKIKLLNESADLDSKVDSFIKWYYENMVKGCYTYIGEYDIPKKMRNLIEKIAVCYELKYPDYTVNCTRLDEHNELINEGFKLLSAKEKYYFFDPKYKNVVYLNPLSSFNACLHLSSNGIVEVAENITVYTNSIIKDEELQGLNIREVVDLFKAKNIKLPENNGLEKELTNVDNLIYQKEEMLNCIMYRIIERGGNRFGPRRAFLFAKEYGRNIDIPMMYALDYSDPNLESFINEYIKAGGSKDLECYVNYFNRSNKKEKIDTITIQDFVLNQDKDFPLYSPEKEIHQELINAITSQIDQEIHHEKQKKLKINNN